MGRRPPPAPPRTNGELDGRWLFINGNNAPRVARLDLRTFETDGILFSGGNHGPPFITEKTEYVIASTRFGVPIPQRDVSVDDYKANFGGTLSWVRVDRETGHMSIAFQLRVPGFNYDPSHSGKGPSHGWSFLTTYNT